jgi:hypothetical protein
MGHDRKLGKSMKAADLQETKTKELPPINPDQPLQASNAISHDKLQRRGFAAAAVAALQRVSCTTGFVLSIEGTWGSGKTSTLSMMEQLICTDDDEGSVIVHFNPWLIGERNSLLRQFLSTVAAAIELKDPVENAKKVSKELLNYASVLDFVKWVPGAEPWASIVKGVLKSAGKAAGGVADQKERDIEGQKNKLEKALAEFDRKIYVFIDDVDRLVPSEVFEMVRIIKAIGHLPSVGYVVAWDPEYVQDALKAAAIPGAANYIDKIVQIRLPIPAISTNARLQLLNDGIASLPAEATADRFPHQTNRLESLYFHGLRELLEQPRDFTRVMNTLSVIDPGLRGEIVFADLLGLACLIVRAPRVYDAVRKRPELFTKTHSEYPMDAGKAAQEQHREKMEQLFATTSNPDAIRSLVYFLFPVAAKAGGGFAFGNSIDVEGHLAAPSRLNIAMSMAIGATDVSLMEARQFILQADKRAEIESKLTPENCLGFLEMLGDLATTLSKGEVTDLEGLCCAIARLVDKKPTSTSAYRHRFFTIPAERLAIAAIEHLVASGAGLTASKAAFAVASAPEALTVAADVIYSGLSTNQEEGAIVCDARKQKMAASNLVRNTITSIRNGTFWTICDPSRVLWTIMGAAPPQLAKKVFSEVKRSDPSLDEFALHFLKHSFSSNGGQSYALPEGPEVSNLVNVKKLTAHAKRRLAEKTVGYPVRAAWRSIVEKKALYGADGSVAR